MKVYKVSYRDDFSEHQGYEYFSNKADATKAQKADNKKRGVDEENGIHIFDEVACIEFEPTKKGILKMLNIHCSYPDNG